MYVPSQWETTLYCNVVCHWLGTCSKWYLTGLLFLWDWLGNVPILWRAYLLWVTTDGLRLAERVSVNVYVMSFPRSILLIHSGIHQDCLPANTFISLYLNLVHPPWMLAQVLSPDFMGSLAVSHFELCCLVRKIIQNHWSPENFDRNISTFVVSTELADGLAPY